ncbi:hypothetical protein N7466_008544 [Penicillium verhagenii]|uniref:uncharacterized protein n=1 Tax=Penicillium verhagenii TaxID=1562060 RepID=UPI002545B2D3|nr:uncharacterized protein N7466_008544 [Penicillium verhagenii]KAJ5924357.1 hypothetical protein N7466_008544 [Penicillium verhagenii]
MYPPTHIIDPDGEVMILLRDANSEFAQPYDMTVFDSSSEDERRISGIKESPFEKLPDETPEFRIQVSAKHLMFASPVFKKLLTGHFKESVTYWQEGSVEITAESWDLEAFMIVLRAIHGLHAEIPQELSLEMVAKVAVIADYYDCKAVLYLMTDMWLNSMEKINYEEVKLSMAVVRDLIIWLWISWTFQLSSKFKETTSIAMSRSFGLIDSLGLPIPHAVIESMNKIRQGAINELLILFHETRDEFLHGIRGCCFCCRTMLYGALTFGMRSASLTLPKPETPFTELSYYDLVRRIEQFHIPSFDHGGGSSDDEETSSSEHGEISPEPEQEIPLTPNYFGGACPFHEEDCVGDLKKLMTGRSGYLEGLAREDFPIS